MNKLVYCVPCNIKMDINDCFKHKQTITHITKFESLKKNVVRYQHTMIMQEGILFTTEEERQKANQRRKLNKLNK
jgi:predicted aldo/keto reductase-like oxidoreductase